MGNILDALEPKEVYRFFKEISAIPRPSHHTEKISAYLERFGLERGLYTRRDDLGNVVIKKEASEGFKDKEPVILQGHMDMVAVKTPDSAVDPYKDGLDLQVEDGYLYAKGTSLGGDDGIAVAFMLALLDGDYELPKLECIFTVEEEVGMDGALGLDMSDIEGKELINIDSEVEGILTLGCAGGIRLNGKFKLEKENTYSGKITEINISGLKGGHSGIMIHLGRANSHKLMGRVLKALETDGVDYRLVSIEGGEKDNAIANNTTVKLVIKAGEDKLQDIIRKCEDAFKKEYEGIEDNIRVNVSSQEVEDTVYYNKATAKRIVDFLNIVPDGVIKMSEDLPDMVETSLNIGTIVMEDDYIVTDQLLRSNAKAGKKEILDVVSKCIQDVGAENVVFGDCPNWEYRKDSPLREKMVRIFKEEYGYEPKLEVVHAGLECGIFCDKKEDLDPVSIGPNILDIHTVKEKLDIESVNRTWKYLLKILQDVEG